MAEPVNTPLTPATPGLCQRWLCQLRTFFRTTLWDTHLSSLPPMKRAGMVLLRIGAIVVKGFATRQSVIHASALTYFTLMSLVPVLALMFFLARGAGAQDKLLDVVGMEHAADGIGYVVTESSRLSEFPAQAQQIAAAVFAAVDNTNFGTLGVVGLILLLWSSISAMGRIENAFNSIWGVAVARPFSQKVAYYIALIVLVPVLVIAVTSANALLSSDRVSELMQLRLGPLFWVYRLALKLIGAGVLFVAFTVLYMFMPNTRVRLLPAVVAGIVGGGLWYLAQVLYFTLQMGLSRSNAIYGTFAAIPFFLVWLNTSWTIVLLGAQVAFAVQNVNAYLDEDAVRDTSFATHRALAMVIVYQICQDFHAGRREWTPVAFSRTQDIPLRVVMTVLNILRRQGVIEEIAGKVTHYVPGRDLATLTMKDVHDAVAGEVLPHIGRTAEALTHDAQEIFARTFKDFSDALASVSFRDLVTGTKA